MNIAEILTKQTQQLPDTPAIIEKGRALTFAQLHNHISCATTFFVKHDLHAGDALLVFQPVSVDLYVILLAAFRLGLVVVFIDPQAGYKHVESCCKRYPPKALIATSKAHLLRLVSSSLRQIPKKFVIGFPLPGAIHWKHYRNCPPNNSVHASLPNDPALITFTSGSTGQPKAAVRTHDFLLSQHKVLAHSLQLQAKQVDLITLPIFVLANLASGVTSLIPNADLRKPGSIKAAPVLQQIRRYNAIRCAASPAFFERLLDHCERSGEKLNTFKEIYTGGAPVFPRLLARLAALSSRADVVAVYGSTEAEPIAHISKQDISIDDNAAMISGKGLLAGLPVDEIALRILPDQWGQAVGPYTKGEFDNLCLAEGGIGEIVVSGDHVLSGYLDGYGDLENKFEVDGVRWHRTGDAGYLDTDGRLWLMGRCAARVEDEQGRIYSFAVEVAATQYDFVHRAAFISVAGKRLLVLETDKVKRADIQRIKQDLDWANLHDVRIVSKVPVDKRHNAKIDYPALQKMLRACAK